MKRFEIIQHDLLLLYQAIPDPLNRHLCITHHTHVLEAMMQMSKHDVMWVAAFMHDCSLYLGIPGNHAIQSAKYARHFLENYSFFTEKEIDFIARVISLHSDKKNIHFEEAELLKKADIQAHHLEDLYI